MRSTEKLFAQVGFRIFEIPEDDSNRVDILYVIYLKTLIIHKIKTKEINTETEFGYLRKNLHKLAQLSFQFSPKIRICFRCNMKHSEECFILHLKQMRTIGEN